MALGLVETLTDKTVLVTGASSQIGVFSIPLLLAAGFRVIALSRSPRPDRFPDMAGVTWSTPEKLRGFPHSSVTGLLSAGPLALATQWLAHFSAVQSVAATSSSSVLVKVDSEHGPERDVIQRLLGEEDRLLQAARERRINLCILRPTLVYGSGLDRNLTLISNLIERFGFVPVASNADGLRQPVHAQDVAAALVNGLKIKPEVPLVNVFCGDSTISYREMVERVFLAMGRKPRVLALPAPLLIGAQNVLNKFAGQHFGHPEMVRRQSVDLTFDDQETRRILEITPRKFYPAERDFKYPDTNLLKHLSLAHQ